jgi:hypothetical protein
MHTKPLVWLAVIAGLCAVVNACGTSSESGTSDSGLECEEGQSAEDCDGSQLPNDDGSVDEEAQPDVDAASDERDAASDERDAAQVDERDAAVDETVDPNDGSVELDGGSDATVIEPAPTCRGDYECGYGECKEELDAPICDCLAGYADDGAGCVWVGDGETGGIVDSELDDAAAWTGTNVVIADGVARFGTAGVGDACELGVLQQELQMPLRSESQPLVLELDVLSSCASANAESCPALQVELGASASRVVIAGEAGAAAAPVARKVAVCLGQAGYGPNVMLRVRPALAYQHGELPLDCETAEWPEIDRIAIRAAAGSECAADNALAGGLSSAAGWQLTNASIAGDQLAIMAGGRAETTVAFGASVGSTALRVRSAMTGPNARIVGLTLDGLTWSVTRVVGEATVCVPAWVAGASHRLAIAPVDDDVVITELSIVNLAACGDNAFDAQFDRVVAGGTWSTRDGMGARTASGLDGGGYVIGRSGSLLASLRFSAREGGYRFSPHALYRGGLAQTSAIDFTLDASAGESTASASWQERTACLPPRWERQLATLRLDVTMTPNTAGGAVNMTFDDLGIFFAAPQECE